jgi:hypothetical protein
MEALSHCESSGSKTVGLEAFLLWRKIWMFTGRACLSQMDETTLPFPRVSQEPKHVWEAS